MNSSKFRFTLDLHSIQSQYSIPVMLGDTSVVLLISITDGGVPFIINDGCIAKLSIKRPTGTYLEEFCKIRNNAIIEYPFRQNKNTCAVEGIHHCDVTLYDPDGEVLGGPRFIMVVNEKVVRRDDIVLTDEDWRAVDGIIAAEANRITAEEERVTAEEGRATAEEERDKAEKARVAADAERIAAVKEDATKAEEAAKAAALSAQNAQKSVEDANAHVGTASNHVESARLHKEAAQLSATNAKNSENTAKSFADEASMSASAASASAEVAREFAFSTEEIGARITRNEKRIRNIEQGIPPEQFVVDSGVSYVKDVPKDTTDNALITMIGGMTRKCENLIPDNIEGGALGINGGKLVSYTSGETCHIKGIPLKAGTYTASGVDKIYFYVYDKNGVVDLTKTAAQGTLSPYTFTVDTDCYCGITGSREALVKHMLNIGSTALPYEPYFEGLRSAPTEKVESVGANIFGGDALADAFVETIGATKDAATKTITFLASAIHGKRFYSYYKPNTAYTFMIYGKRSNNARTGLGIRYTDGSNEWLSFQSVNAESYCVFTSDANRAVSFLFGYDEDGGTCTFNYDKCGVFEGVLTADDFKPYVKHTLPIPEAVRPANGINADVHDSITWDEDGKRRKHVKCGVVDLGTLGWNAAQNVWYTTKLVGIAKPEVGLCGKYSLVPTTATSLMPNKSIQIRGDIIYLYDTDVTDASQITGTLLYALATPTTEDISDILPADNYIEVEGGGTLTFKNEYEYDVPSEVVYQLKEATA